ncbi:hypothetical protein TNCV_1168261 [Trichonephila clavipes]|uniref:Uncharacterized protein n=1 Tax=Trichonephila clavipes TaxID=2585209 RepID=A0A8X6VK29_TRICX|nr:hypothetical protein TNCV_1168261 [Trichonephila clavipes]
MFLRNPRPFQIRRVSLTSVLRIGITGHDRFRSACCSVADSPISWVPVDTNMSLMVLQAEPDSSEKTLRCHSRIQFVLMCLPDYHCVSLCRMFKVSRNNGCHANGPCWFRRNRNAHADAYPAANKPAAAPPSMVVMTLDL